MWAEWGRWACDRVIEVIEMLACLFTLVFIGKICLQKSQAPGAHGPVWSNDRLAEGLG